MKVNMDKYLGPAGVKCLPFIGEKYRDGGPCGLRVLALGESHYNENGKFGPGFTREVMKDILDGKTNCRSYAYYTKVATLFSPDKASLSERAGFFKTIAFYNFIQEAIKKPRMRPTTKMWDNAQAPFEAVIKFLKPELVVVLGSALWDRIGITTEPLPPVKLKNGKVAPMDYCEMDGHRCVFFGMSHPSLIGYDIWRPALQAAIKRVSATKSNS
jgi:hypothetical protein